MSELDKQELVTQIERALVRFPDDIVFVNKDKLETLLNLKDARIKALEVVAEAAREWSATVAHQGTEAENTLDNALKALDEREPTS